MSKFTPGPWIALDTSIYKIENGKVTRKRITKVQKEIEFKVKAPLSEVQANAQLIAAAPDLHKLICEVLDCDFRQPELSDKWYDSAKIIRKKIEGTR